ncbi:hypothetical protein FPQ15_05315 [Gilliamella apicola]|uniref:Uncharacterized protein n=1 Tax=Gilliamella apicola TaxID=1196095 RepID=A0A556SQL0_9GAMM|nr:hypothetical protein FPQ15_05315 [Gilliamella apicola]
MKFTRSVFNKQNFVVNLIKFMLFDTKTNNVNNFIIELLI